MSDSALAQEIRSRGIDGDYTRADVERLRAAGLTGEALAAVRQLLPTSMVTVRTTPGAAVQLGSGPVVVADSGGLATFAELESATYEIRAKLEYRHDVLQVVRVNNRQSITIDLPLTWRVGFLTVRTDPAEAIVTGPGLLPQRGGFTRYPFEVGEVTIKAMSAFRQPRSETVRIEPGSERSLVLALPPDDAAFKTAEAEVTNLFRLRRHAEVAGRGAAYVAAGGKNQSVLGYIAGSRLELRQYDAFGQLARSVLSSGGGVIVQVYHHHLVAGGFGGASLHPADLEFSRAGLIVRSASKCNLPEVLSPIAQVHFRSRRAMLHKDRFAESLSVEIPDPGNPRKRITANLLMGSSASADSPAALALTFTEDAEKMSALRSALEILVR